MKCGVGTGTQCEKCNIKSCSAAGRGSQRALCSFVPFQTELPLHSLVVMSSHCCECTAQRQAWLCCAANKACSMGWDRWLQTPITASHGLLLQSVSWIRLGPPPGRTDHGSPTLDNSSRNTVYFSEKSVTSLPAEKPR